MAYENWFESHAKKHQALLLQLQHAGMMGEELVGYFVYENMARKERAFCPLYASGKKCHAKEYLNCYLCACPHFRFNDKGLHVKENGVVVKSVCAVNSRFAKQFVHEGTEHLDCSDCSLPHTKAFVRTFAGKPWKEAMGACKVEQNPLHVR